MNVPFIFDVYLHKGTQALIHECKILSYTDTHAHAHTHIYTHTQTDTRTCTRTHTRTPTTHTHAHTHDACTGIKTTLHLFDSINFFVCLTWRMNICDITHPCAWHDYFIRVIWLLYKCDMTHSSVRWISIICVIRLMTPAYMWHDSLCLTATLTATHTCDVALAYVWHDSFISAIRLYHLRDMAPAYSPHNFSWLPATFTANPTATQLQHPLQHPLQQIHVTWLFHMCDAQVSKNPDETNPKKPIQREMWDMTCSYVTWLVPWNASCSRSQKRWSGMMLQKWI